MQPRFLSVVKNANANPTNDSARKTVQDAGKGWTCERDSDIKNVPATTCLEDCCVRLRFPGVDGGGRGCGGSGFNYYRRCWFIRRYEGHKLHLCLGRVNKLQNKTGEINNFGRLETRDLTIDQIVGFVALRYRGLKVFYNVFIAVTTFILDTWFFLLYEEIHNCVRVILDLETWWI